jgi:hypothetical protein
MRVIDWIVWLAVTFSGVAIAFGPLLRRRRGLAMMERGMREIRAAISGPIVARVASEGEPAVVELRQAIEKIERELASCGFRVLGEFLLEASGLPKLVAMRAFVDPATDTMAWVSIIRITGPTSRAVARVARKVRKPSVAFVSWTGKEAWTTHGDAAASSYAKPPFVHSQTVDPDLHVDQILELHRNSLPASNTELVHVTSIDHFAAEIHRRHEMTRNWRAAQAPDLLLDADLRAALGPHYARWGHVIKRRLTDTLPKAVVRPQA